MDTYCLLVGSSLFASSSYLSCILIEFFLVRKTARGQSALGKAKLQTSDYVWTITTDLNHNLIQLFNSEAKRVFIYMTLI